MSIRKRMEIHRWALGAWLSIPLLCLCGVSARASDGVLEINQACAVGAGCFVGDAPSFPVTITKSGSYRLTSDLTLPDANTTGILVSASDVGINLSNFAIIRAGCEGAQNSCAPPSGTGSGISAPGTHGVSVHDGSVVGMVGGISLASQGEVRNVLARWNRTGISAFTGSAILNSIARENGRDGIVVGPGSTVSGNLARGNGRDGIQAGDGSTVLGNTAFGNTEDGIQVGIGSSVQRNVTGSNGVAGLRLGAWASYRGNTITNNGFTVLGGVNAGANLCNLVLTCP